MSKSLSLALILAVGTASIPVSAFASDEGTAQQPVKKVKKPKKICKTNAGVTGSRIAKRICKTADEWADAASDAEMHAKSKG